MTKHSKQKVLVFDMDDTLYKRSDPYLKTVKEFFPGGLPVEEAELLETAHSTKERLFKQQADGLISMREMLIGRTVETYKSFGIALSEEEAWRFETRYKENLLRMKVSPLLLQLLGDLAKAGCRMGVLTNGDSVRQREKLQSLGAAAFFREQDVLVTGDVGIPKPETGIFRAYEERTGLAPGDLWLIGDSYETDVCGAKRAGWHAVWFNWRKETLPAGAEKPDREAKTEEELSAAVRELACLPNHFHTKEG